MGAVTITAGSIGDGSLTAQSCSLSADSTVTLTGTSNNLGVVTLEYGSTINGSYVASSQTVIADDGDTDVLSSIFAGWNLLVTNGTTVDLAGTSTTLGTVSVINGSILDSVGGGTLTANTLSAVNATVGGDGTDVITVTGDVSLINVYITASVVVDGNTTVSGLVTMSDNLVVKARGSLDVESDSCLVMDAGSTFSTMERSPTKATSRWQA